MCILITLCSGLSDKNRRFGPWKPLSLREYLNNWLLHELKAGRQGIMAR